MTEKANDQPAVNLKARNNRIAIIGAGQSGLQLGIGLLSHNFSVSLFSNRSAEEILAGKILSSQVMMHSAIECEKLLGLDYWDGIAPVNQSVTLSLLLPDNLQRVFQWQGKTSKPFHSVDQRLKFSKWIDGFKEMGGNLYVQDVKPKSLNAISDEHELTIIATGKGELSALFPRDPERSCFDKPQRRLFCIYLKNVKPSEDPRGVRAVLLPGIGEYFTTPGLTLNNQECEMVLIEGINDSPFDCWQDIADINQHAEKLISLLKQFIPWEYERFIDAEPTDQQAALVGAYTPTVRSPCFKLENNKYVFGMGDTLVLNDPIAGQGANNAAKAAYIYMQSIINRGDLPFDSGWMHETFDDFWYKYGKWSTNLSNLLLLPPPPHVVNLLSEAANSQLLANRLADAFNNPAELFPWILDADATSREIKKTSN
jgi:hypothetical protein